MKNPWKRYESRASKQAKQRSMTGFFTFMMCFTPAKRETLLFISVCFMTTPCCPPVVTPCNFNSFTTTFTPNLERQNNSKVTITERDNNGSIVASPMFRFLCAEKKVGLACRLCG